MWHTCCSTGGVKEEWDLLSVRELKRSLTFIVGHGQFTLTCIRRPPEPPRREGRGRPGRRQTSVSTSPGPGTSRLVSFAWQRSLLCELHKCYPGVRSIAHLLFPRISPISWSLLTAWEPMTSIIMLSSVLRRFVSRIRLGSRLPCVTCVWFSSGGSKLTVAEGEPPKWLSGNKMLATNMSGFTCYLL